MRSAAPIPLRKVVITGMGIISSIGLSCAEVRDSLQRGKSGIVYLDERKKLGFRSALSGVIRGYSPPDDLERRYRKTLPEFGLWAWSAIAQALEQAAVDPASLAGDERTGLIFGNDSSVVTGVEQCEMLRQTAETKSIGSGHIFRLLNSTISLNISTKLKLCGVSWTVSGACASGMMAIGQAAELIARGRQDRIICGSAQEISWQSMCSFDGIGAFSTREDDPTRASRPFDRDRDGLVPSGGAAALFLEAEDSAKKRGAPILAEVRGYGTSSDGHHLSSPSGKGLERSMLLALHDADISAAEIDLVMAHATSTPAGDDKEAEVLLRLLSTSGRGARPHVVATKSLTGHEFWMAGTSQVVYAVLMSRAGWVAAHPTLENPDKHASQLRIPRSTEFFNGRRILCNSAGFGGVNAALVLEITA